MKYTVYYNKFNKFGISDGGQETFDSFIELKYAEDVLDNLDVYVDEEVISGWDNVQKGDYIKFTLCVEAENDDEVKALGGIYQVLDSSCYTGIVYGLNGETNE